MKHVQEWCKGKPILLRIFAKLLVFSPADTHWGMELNRRGEWPEEFPVPADHRVWLALYRRSRRMLEVVCTLASRLDEKLVSRLVLFYAGSKALQRTPRDVLVSYFESLTPAQLKFYCARAQYLWTDSEKRLDRLLTNWLNGTSPADKAPLEILASPEMQFFIRVWLPCIHAHGMPPARLLRRARSGDISACEMLIQLDKTAQFDPRIAKIMHQNGHTRPHRVRNMLAQAALKPAYRRIGINTHKARIAAYLIQLGRKSKCPLNARHIRKLFNAAARDMNPKGRILTDHGISDYEGFRKSIQRAHPFWDQLMAAGWDMNS